MCVNKFQYLIRNRVCFSINPSASLQLSIHPSISRFTYISRHRESRKIHYGCKPKPICDNPKKHFVKSCSKLSQQTSLQTTKATTSPHLRIQSEQLGGKPEWCLRFGKCLDDNCLAATGWSNNHCGMSRHHCLVRLHHFLHLQTAIFPHLCDYSEIFHFQTVHKFQLKGSL